jgi:murein DD-endopeptidase MepM/ murein hydrolase activator NlpD
VPPRNFSSDDDTVLQGKRRARTACLLAAATVLGFAVAAEPSAAAGTAMAPGGGAMFVEKPRLAKVSCLRRCASRKRAQPGSTLKITGTGLSAVRHVIFHGSFGTRDDVDVPVRSGSSKRLNARVPIDAVTGALSVETRDGLSSRRTRPVQILPPPPPDPNPTLTPVPGFRQRGAPQLETGTSRTRAFFGARRTVVFSYRIAGLAAAARVELVRARDGAVIQTWNAGSPAAGAVQSIVWNGTVARVPAPPGRYAFRLTVAGRTGAIARSAQVGNFTRDAFDLFDHQFPVRGRHDYGQAAARFGAGRAGHTHQGQDVMAACGTPMVAARGGRVKFKGYHRLAGNYIVIDGDGTGIDYVYMHLAEPSPFDARDRVYTGQRIGAVGETGDAHGCHLHLELWSAPGWYDGGHPFDPLPALKAWDAYS